MQSSNIPAKAVTVRCKLGKPKLVYAVEVRPDIFAKRAVPRSEKRHILKSARVRESLDRCLAKLRRKSKKYTMRGAGLTMDDMAPGDVLVAPYTDPAWTPLFPGAAAIIVEVGSYLSHAGTVAREYGIPCLVDVHGCTEKIRSGQSLKINASEGWVEIVE